MDPTPTPTPNPTSMNPTPHLKLTSFTGKVSQVTDWVGGLSRVDYYQKIETLGEGTYGLVSRARDPVTNQLYAIKAMKVTSNVDLDITVLREIKLLQRLRHRHIVRLDEVLAGTYLGTTYLRMESCYQDMDQFLRRCKSPLSSRQIFRFFEQLMLGLEFLHNNQILHRDLKPANLLLTEDLELKIADFGMARSFTETGDMTPGVVTLWYRAPELLLSCQNYDYSVDIWSSGLILGELCLGHPVLTGESEIDQLIRITDLLGSPDKQTQRELRHLKIKSSTLNLIPTERKPNFTKLTSKSPQWAHPILTSILTWDPYSRKSPRKVLALLYN